MELLEQLARRDNRNPGDYEQDGILMCGVCHQPKQDLVEWLDGRKRLVPIMCQCEIDEKRQKDEERAMEQFTLSIADMQERYNITDTSYKRMTFDLDDGHNKKVSDVCRRYVDQWESMKADNVGMLFYGTVGTGKSFLACSIVNALLRRKVRATVTNFPRLLNVLQSARDRQEIIDHLQYYKLLVIDDLGVERDSSYAAEQVYGVIDARARAGLPLIVTTNLTLDELKDPPTMQYRRIYDRVLELCPVMIKMNGESRRTGNAELRREKAKKLLIG